MFSRGRRTDETERRTRMMEEQRQTRGPQWSGRVDDDVQLNGPSEPWTELDDHLRSEPAFWSTGAAPPNVDEASARLDLVMQGWSR